MRRRDFIGILGGTALTWPRCASTQPAMPLIGYLSSKDASSEAGITAAARRGLKDEGFVEGQNVSINYRYGAGDYKRLPDFVTELVRAKVDVIAASGLPATVAAKAGTSGIPIVFRLAIDPVAFGLVRSLDQPGGNVTGVTMLFDPLTPKKLQMLKELVPDAGKVGFLLNPNNQNASSHRDHAERAAANLGWALVILTIGEPNDVEAAFATARKEGAGALLVGDDPLFDVLNRRLVAAAAQYRIPTMFYVRDFVAAAGLISYGPNFDEMATQVGHYLGRILKGAKPSDLPVQQPTRIELVINLKTARSLGLNVPPALLARADEVIE